MPRLRNLSDFLPHPPPLCSSLSALLSTLPLQGSSCCSLRWSSLTWLQGFFKCLFHLRGSFPYIRTLLRCHLLRKAWPFNLEYDFSPYHSLPLILLHFPTSMYRYLTQYYTLMCLYCLPGRIAGPRGGGRNAVCLICPHTLNATGKPGTLGEVHKYFKYT